MTPLERGLHAGLAAVRLAALAWIVVVEVVQRDHVARPAMAIALLTVTLAWSTSAAALRRPVPVGDLLVGALLLAADRHVHEADHPQSFAGAWPLAGALAAGVAWGPLGGACGGLLLGAARWAGAADAPAISLVSSAVLYALAGAVAGDVAQRLRRAESAVAEARAREEFARTLHDGVLQTLAVVQRRSEDPDLARLARDQERELRAWISGAATSDDDADLAVALRRCADRIEEVHGLRVDVVLADDLRTLDATTTAAVAGAVGEALTNAAKHSGGTRATVYAEPDGTGAFVSVKDDGRGFDPAATTPGVGTTRSIRARVEEVGGRVEIAANPGRGTEVRMWVSRR